MQHTRLPLYSTHLPFEAERVGEAALEGGGYDVNILLNEDVDFFCRAIRAFGCRFLDQVVVKLVDSYQRMYERYRETHGAAELLAMKIFARTVMRVFMNVVPAAWSL